MTTIEFHPMLDVVAGIAIGAMIAANVVLLLGLAAIPLRAKLLAAAVAAGWVAAMSGLAAATAARPGVTEPLPMPALALAVLAIASLAAWRAWPAFRSALQSIPVAALVGVNALRVGGILFLLLHADGRLSAPFAPVAGWGDIITGISAVPVALGASRLPWPPRGLLVAWNAFGALDLVVALALALLSAPGAPFHVFTVWPGSSVMATVPWVLVAAVLVPLYLLTHFAIASRLRSQRHRSALGNEPVQARETAA